MCWRLLKNPFGNHSTHTSVGEAAGQGKWIFAINLALSFNELTPSVAVQDFFTEKLSSLCVGWLGDDISTIRQAAAANLKVRGSTSPFSVILS